ASQRTSACPHSASATSWPASARSPPTPTCAFAVISAFRTVTGCVGRYATTQSAPGMHSGLNWPASIPSSAPPEPNGDSMAGSSGIADAQYRDLYFYSLYRVLEAGLLALLLFGPIRELLPDPARPLLGKITSMAYLVTAGGLLYWAKRQVALRWQVVV